jgi:hypothetical protein
MPAHGDEHRERDRERRDERGAEVAEQQKEHEDHERRAFERGSSHGVERRVDEVRAVVDGLRVDALGQGLLTVCIRLVDPAARRRGCCRRPA